MKPLALAAALAAAIALPASAIAGPAEIHTAVILWALDKNSDGAVDRAEADGVRAVIFDAVDANKDGRITKEEAGAALVAAKPNQKGKAAAKIEKKRNDLVTKLGFAKPEGLSKAEFVAVNDTLFAAADADKNGKLTPAELIVLVKSYGPLMPR